MMRKYLDGGATEADGRANAQWSPSEATPLLRECERMTVDHYARIFLWSISANQLRKQFIRPLLEIWSHLKFNCCGNGTIDKITVCTYSFIDPWFFVPHYKVTIFCITEKPVPGSNICGCLLVDDNFFMSHNKNLNLLQQPLPNLFG